MKIAVFNPKGFEFTEQHIRQIKEVVDAEIVQLSESGSVGREITNADVLVTNNYNFDKSWLKSAKKLRYIHSMAAGVERVLPHLPEGIMLANAKGVHAINIAEHVLGFMIMHEHRLDRAFKAQLRKEWIMGELTASGNHTPGELYGKTVAIFGLGNIGRRTAEVCSKLGMKVTGVKSSASHEQELADEVYAAENWREALKNADYVVAAMPYTNKTHYFFNREKFAAMKKGAFFINIGRGSVADENALANALKKHEIKGAGLDVFEQEPLPESSELWEMENVIITPHSAGFTTKYMDRFTEIFCKNLKAFIEGKKLPNLVDRKKGY